MALNVLAAAYDRRRRFDLAERYYRQALAIEPAASHTLNNYAYSHLLRGDHATASRYLEQARLHLVEPAGALAATIETNFAAVRRAADASQLVEADGGGATGAMMRLAEADDAAAWIERRSGRRLYLRSEE